MSKQEATRYLSSDPVRGLSHSEWLKRLTEYVANVLVEKEELSFWRLLWEQFQGFMVKLMLGAAGVSFLLGEPLDAFTIIGIVLLEAVIRVVQEYRAEKSLAALKDLTSPTACVSREGRQIQVDAKKLVPGDIILLEAGDRVPADARLMESANLELIESTLTGEPMPIIKDANTSYDNYPGIADQKNMVFMGTNIIQGRARTLVVSTGMNTQVGQIAQMLNEIGEKETPLQEGLSRLGKNLSLGCIAVAGLIAVTGIIRGKPLAEMLRMGVALAVGAMPEGLVAIVTLAMAFGVQRMVQRNAVVRRLPAVENIGYTNVICSDKTGTMTKNEMTVKEIYTGSSYWEVTGEGYLPQ